MTEETILKSQIKDYLAIKRIFNYPLLQGIGSYKGLPDRIMQYGGQVIYLEIKKPGGKLSEYQIAFMNQCKADGIEYWVIRDLETLIQDIKNLGKLWK